MARTIICVCTCVVARLVKIKIKLFNVNILTLLKFLRVNPKMGGRC
jgi:hypothetical protein